MIQIDILSAQTYLAELIQKTVSGERVIITHDNQPLVELVPLQPNQKRRTLGQGKDSATITPDFNDPLEDSKEYEG